VLGGAAGSAHSTQGNCPARAANAEYEAITGIDDRYVGLLGLSAPCSAKTTIRITAA
jgi:hypothetical protein